MTASEVTVKGEAKIFSGPGGWVYVAVPKKHTDKLKGNVKATAWGFIPITATAGKTSWKTSLLPMGDGSFFIAIKAQVRKKEKIAIGDIVTVKYSLL